MTRMFPLNTFYNKKLIQEIGQFYFISMFERKCWGEWWFLILFNKNKEKITRSAKTFLVRLDIQLFTNIFFFFFYFQSILFSILFRASVRIISNKCNFRRTKDTRSSKYLLIVSFSFIIKFINFRNIYLKNKVFSIFL